MSKMVQIPADDLEVLCGATIEMLAAFAVGGNQSPKHIAFVRETKRKLRDAMQIIWRQGGRKDEDQDKQTG